MEGMGKLNHQYSNSDTALTTYLIVQGFTLSKIDYSAPRFEFYFVESLEKLQEHAQKYLTGKALVDPSVFNRVNRNLMRLVKNNLQWGEE